VVLSSTAFEPYSGSAYLYVVGEILNNTASNVEYTKIKVTLRDPSGNVVATDYSYSMIDTLSPETTSPFLVMFYDAPEWSTYECSVTWDTTTQEPYPMEVLNSASRFDSGDAYHVVGELRNQHAEERTYVKVLITLYDATGAVIGADYSYTEPHTLAPGETVSFDESVYFWAGKPDRSKVAGHLLQAFGD